MMTVKDYRKFQWIVCTILFILASCSFDQVEKRYPDFLSADKDGIFKKGWIPPELTNKSMTDIFIRTNLDLNTCIFSYKLPKTDIEALTSSKQMTSVSFRSPSGIKIPKWWIDSVDKLECYFYINHDCSDTVCLAIDHESNKVLGWTK
jgi:hypothetical protein